MDHSYKDIISLENLYNAWQEFVRGKKYKKDVAEFTFNLSYNIFSLHEDLINKIYSHGKYVAFSINDPKPRNIHKATVRDRLLHHAIYKILYPYFDKKFIYDSYSCRDLKGTHQAVYRFKSFSQKASKSRKKTCWVLKCDIRKFFASVDHGVLMEILKKHIPDQDTLWLLDNVIKSFSSMKKGIGLPLGNLTSQLLVNVYMNEFDQYVKHTLKVKYYIRYADDFIFMDVSKDNLGNILPKVSQFLKEELKLSLHPNKLFIKTVASGVDFLGWVNFSDHIVLRTVTKKRMFKKLVIQKSPKTVASYKGLLSHGNAYKLQKKVMGK